jgi:hypothetical protein
VIQHRQQERGSFTTAGFGRHHDISTFKDYRYAAALDLGSLAEAQRIERFKQLLV